MMLLDVIFALYCVPAAVVLITAAVHGAHNTDEWRNMMGWLAITPFVNIFIMWCIITWYLWKGYHKLFDKKKK